MLINYGSFLVHTNCVDYRTKKWFARLAVGKVYFLKQQGARRIFTKKIRSATMHNAQCTHTHVKGAEHKRGRYNYDLRSSVNVLAQSKFIVFYASSRLTVPFVMTNLLVVMHLLSGNRCQTTCFVDFIGKVVYILLPTLCLALMHCNF